MSPIDKCYADLAGAIIKQAMLDRRKILRGHEISGVTLGLINRFFNSDEFRVMAGTAVDYIREEVYKYG